MRTYIDALYERDVLKIKWKKCLLCTYCDSWKFPYFMREWIDVYECINKDVRKDITIQRECYKINRKGNCKKFKENNKEI